jgi:hypothetical protein
VVKSARNRRLRQAATHRQGSPRALKQGDRAEQYGRSVGDELPDYELAARRGRDSLAAALISRHNQRVN